MKIEGKCGCGFCVSLGTMSGIEWWSSAGALVQMEGLVSPDDDEYCQHCPKCGYRLADDGFAYEMVQAPEFDGYSIGLRPCDNHSEPGILVWAQSWYGKEGHGPTEAGVYCSKCHQPITESGCQPLDPADEGSDDDDG